MEKITLYEIQLSDKILNRQLLRLEKRFERLKKKYAKKNLIEIKMSPEETRRLANKYESALKKLVALTRRYIPIITREFQRLNNNPLPFSNNSGNITTFSNRIKMLVLEIEKLNTHLIRTHEFLTLLSQTNGIGNITGQANSLIQVIRNLATEFQNIRIDAQAALSLQNLADKTKELVRLYRTEYRQAGENARLIYDKRVEYLLQFKQKYEEHIRQLNNLDRTRINNPPGPPPPGGGSGRGGGGRSGGQLNSTFRMDPRELSRSIESVRQLNQALKTSSAETNFQIANQTQKMMSRNISEIRSGTAELRRIINNAHNLDLAQYREHYNRLINAARAAGQDTTELQRQRAKELQNLESKHRERINQIERQGNRQQQRIREEADRQRLMSVEERMRREIQLIIESNREQGRVLRDNEKRMRDSLRDFQRQMGSFRLNILRVDPQGLINDLRDLKRVLGNNNKELQAQMDRDFRKMADNNVENINQGARRIKQALNEQNTLQIAELKKSQKAMLDAQKAFTRQRLEDLKIAQRRELSEFRGSAQEREAFERRQKRVYLNILREQIAEQKKLRQGANSEIERMQREHIARLEALERTRRARAQAAPNERRTGRLGTTPIFEEIKNAGMGILGPFGNILESVSGRLGKFKGIALAAAAGLGVFLSTTAQAIPRVREFEYEVANISTLLDDSSMDQLPESMSILGSASEEAAVPLSDLQRGMKSIISATPRLAGDLNKVAEITGTVAKAAKGLETDTKSLAAATTNMANALNLPLEEGDNLNFILDTLSATMKFGVIPSGEQLSRNIARTAPQMAALTANTRDTVTAISAMTSVLTAGGVPSVSEAQTQIKGLANELLNASKKTELMNMGIKGFTPEGKIKDWNLFFRSISENMGQVTKLFTSIEAKNAVMILAKESGAVFKDVFDQTAGSAGLANSMFEKVHNTGRATVEGLGVAWNKFLINFGHSQENISNAFLSGLTSMINGLSMVFEPAHARLARYRVELEETNKLNELFIGIINTEDDVKFLDAVQGNMEEIREISPFVANQIEEILSNDSTATADKLALVHEKMEEIQETTENIRFIQMNNEIKEMAKNFDISKNEFKEFLELANLSSRDIKNKAEEISSKRKQQARDNFDMPLGMASSGVADPGSVSIHEIQNKLLLEQANAQKIVAEKQQLINDLSEKQIHLSVEKSERLGNEINLENIISGALDEINQKTRLWLRYNEDSDLLAQKIKASVESQAAAYLQNIEVQKKIATIDDYIKEGKKEQLKTELDISLLKNEGVVNSLKEANLLKEIVDSKRVENNEKMVGGQLSLEQYELNKVILGNIYDKIDAEIKSNEEKEYELAQLADENIIRDISNKILNEKLKVAEGNIVAEEALLNQIIETHNTEMDAEKKKMEAILLTIDNEFQAEKDTLDVMNLKSEAQNYLNELKGDTSAAQTKQFKTEVENLEALLETIQKYEALEISRDTASKKLSEVQALIRGYKALGIDPAKATAKRMSSGRKADRKGLDDKSAKVHADKAAIENINDFSNQIKGQTRSNIEMNRLEIDSRKKYMEEAKNRAREEMELWIQQKKEAYEKLKSEQKLTKELKKTVENIQKSFISMNEDSIETISTIYRGLFPETIRETVSRRQRDITSEFEAGVKTHLDAIDDYEQNIRDHQDRIDLLQGNIREAGIEIDELINSQSSVKGNIKELTQSNALIDQIRKLTAEIDNLEKNPVKRSTATGGRSMEDLINYLDFIIEEGRKKDIQKNEYDELGKKMEAAGKKLAIAYLNGTTAQYKELKESLKNESIEDVVDDKAYNNYIQQLNSKINERNILSRELSKMTSNDQMGTIEDNQGLLESYNQGIEARNTEIANFREEINKLTAEMYEFDAVLQATKDTLEQEAPIANIYRLIEEGVVGNDEYIKSLKELGDEYERVFNETSSLRVGVGFDFVNEAVAEVFDSLRKEKFTPDDIEDKIKEIQSQIAALEISSDSGATKEKLEKELKKLEMIQGILKTWFDRVERLGAGAYEALGKNLRKTEENFANSVKLIDSTRVKYNEIFDVPMSNLEIFEQSNKEAIKGLEERLEYEKKLKAEYEKQGRRRDVEETVKEIEKIQLQLNKIDSNGFEKFGQRVAKNLDDIKKLNEELSYIDKGVKVTEKVGELGKKTYTATVQTMDGKLAELRKTEEKIAYINETIKQGNLSEPQTLEKKLDVALLQKESKKQKIEIARSIIAGAQQAIDMLPGMIDQIEIMIGSVQAGGALNVAEGIGAGADISMQIGKALLSSALPSLQIAGAVLLGVGLLGKAISKIMSFFAKYEKTRLEQAEDRLRVQKLLIGQYDTEINRMKTLIELGNMRLDQAREQAEYTQAEFDKMRQENPLIDLYAGQSDERLADNIRESQSDLNIVESAMDIMDNPDAGRARRTSDVEDLIDMLPDDADFRDIKDKAQKALTDGMIDGITKSEYDEIFSDVDTLSAELQEKLEAANVVLDHRTGMLKTQADILQEMVDISGFRISISTDLEDIENIGDKAEKVTKLYRDNLDEMFSELGINTANKSESELKEFLDNYAAEMDNQLSPALLSAIEDWRGAMEGEEAALSDVFGNLIERNNLKTQIAKDDLDYLTEQEANENNLELLNKQLEAAIEIGSSENYILEIKAQINELEKESINNNREENKILEELISKRQKLLHQSRQDGNIDTGEAAALANVEGQIRAQLEGMGLSQEEIDDVINSMEVQRFKSGGYVEGGINEAVPAVLHGGERVLSNSEINKIGRQKIEEMISKKHQKPTNADTEYKKMAMNAIDNRIEQSITQNFNIKGTESELMKSIETATKKIFKSEIVAWERERNKYRG